MSHWDGLNRRKFPRIQYPCLVTVKHGEGSEDVLLSHTENVGIGGVCVTLKKAIKIFSPVEIELDLMDFEDHIKCPGKVVWSIRRKESDPHKPFFYDIGIEYGELGEGDQKRLDTVIQRLIKQGNIPLP